MQEKSATIMAGFGLLASIVQFAGYAQAAGGLYAMVQVYVMYRYWKNGKTEQKHE